MKSTKDLRSLAVPRWFIGVASESRLTLHVFTDASSYTHGAIVYVTSGRTSYRSLVIAKSCIMPKASEKWSIPKKELLAMGEGMRISLIALKAIDRHIDTLHIWNDSMPVYSWITNSALRTERIVTHRVEHILEDQKKINAVQYHYVKTKDNPADVASRDIDLKRDREKIDLWIHGPQ